MIYMASMSSLYPRRLNRILDAPQFGLITLVLTLSISLLISARSWSASWCQEGVLEILGSRSTSSPTLKKRPSLRVLLSTGKISLKSCSFWGEPELSWRRSPNSTPLFYLKAQRQPQGWRLSWRPHSSHLPWRSFNTLFDRASKLKEHMEFGR